MKLLIRSQDKTILTPINEPLIVFTRRQIYGLEKEYKKYQIHYKNSSLGEYKSKERALEVLDEIQSRLDDFVNNDYLKNVTDVSKQVYIAPFIVYEMPKE